MKIAITPYITYVAGEVENCTASLSCATVMSREPHAQFINCDTNCIEAAEIPYSLDNDDHTFISSIHVPWLKIHRSDVCYAYQLCESKTQPSKDLFWLEFSTVIPSMLSIAETEQQPGCYCCLLKDYVSTQDSMKGLENANRKIWCRA